MQIQPIYSIIDQYAPLYEKEGLFFEILDLSLYYWDENDFKDAIIWYKNSQKVKSLHGYFIDINPASGDPGICEYSQSACRKSCEVAQKIGADGIVFHSSCFPNLRGYYMENWAKKSGMFFTKLTEEYPVKIYIENCADFDPGPIKQLMKWVDNEKVKVCLDTGHAFLSREPLDIWFKELKDYIGYVHLSDNMGLYDDHMALGTGKLDMKLINDYCSDLPSDTRCTLEVGNITEIEKSIEYIKETGYFEYFL